MIAETGLGFYALADRQTDEAMGYCGLAKADLPGILQDGSVKTQASRNPLLGQGLCHRGCGPPARIWPALPRPPGYPCIRRA